MPVELGVSFTGVFYQRANLPIANHGGGALYVNNKIYYFARFSTATYEYNPLTNTWSAKANKPDLRGYFGIGAIGNNIYLFGGSYGTYYNTILKYDTINNAWSTLSAPLILPEGREGIACASYNSKVYLLGGYNGSTYTNQILEFNGTDLITKSVTLPIPKSGGLAAAYNNIIYYMGGIGGSGTEVYAYNPITNSITTKSSLPAPRWYIGMFNGYAHNGYIFCLGGYDTNGGANVDTILVYSPAFDKWYILNTRLPRPLRLFGLAYDGKGYWLIGGYDGTQNRSEVYFFAPDMLNFIEAGTDPMGVSRATGTDPMGITRTTGTDPMSVAQGTRTPSSFTHTTQSGVDLMSVSRTTGSDPMSASSSVGSDPMGITISRP